jgi:carbon monoxide dehydrogenase subunit G
MDVGGEYTFDAPRALVWQALQDPQVLASVMPGGEEFKEVDENEYAGILNIRVGPVQGKFSGNIKLTDIVEPTSYKMTVDGKGAPGFVRASGRLQLTDQGDATGMVYEGTAQIGGRIASVGQRLLDASAKSIIRQSLEGLNEYMKAQVALSAADSADLQEESEESPAQAPELDYQPPSLTAVAMNVARDVVGDLLRPEYRPVAFGAVAVLVVVILILVLT